MAFKDVFKRKPSGTFVGNLIRKAVNQASGGVLGNGAMKIDQQEYDSKNLTDSDFQYKYRKSKTGVPSNTGIVIPTIKTIEQQSDENFDKSIKNSKLEVVKTFIKKYWYWIALPTSLVLVWKLILGSKSKRKYKY
jgi:hypothetical protein